ncbi:ATP-dependent DNA helicase RecG, partial [Candidatus Bathyarchaeota archaeon]
MLKTELLELIRNGENSGVEFKRDDVQPDNLAKEISALLNLEGGHILLGVEDDSTVSGLVRDLKAAEEWVMTVCRDHIQPGIIPYWERLSWDESKTIGVITLPADSPDKPYKGKRGSSWQIFVRVGSTSRVATREEEARLYQASGLMRYDLKPVLGTTITNLDHRRLDNYFSIIRQQASPDKEDVDAWKQLLTNTDFMVEDREKSIPTTGAILLFGKNPNRFLPQAGITATAYPGTDKDYASKERTVLRGSLVSIVLPDDELQENGIIEQAIDFVRRNTEVEGWIDEEGRRQDRWKDYPLEAVREAVVNAIAHRDYTISVVDIELSIYSDRLEIISPGRLPNT